MDTKPKNETKEKGEEKARTATRGPAKVTDLRVNGCLLERDRDTDVSAAVRKEAELRGIPILPSGSKATPEVAIRKAGRTPSASHPWRGSPARSTAPLGIRSESGGAGSPGRVQGAAREDSPSAGHGGASLEGGCPGRDPAGASGAIRDPGEGSVQRDAPNLSGDAGTRSKEAGQGRTGFVQGSAQKTLCRVGGLDIGLESISYHAGVLTLKLDLRGVGKAPIQEPGEFDVPTYIGDACREAIEAAAEVLGVPPQSLRGKTRAMPWVLGRQAAMHGAYEATEGSFSTIARWFNVDHGTVMYAYHKIEETRRTDTSVAKLVHAIEAALQF